MNRVGVEVLLSALVANGVMNSKWIKVILEVVEAKVSLSSSSGPLKEEKRGILSTSPALVAPERLR